MCLFQHALSRRKLIFVIGNEACDLDSTACALAYGFYKHMVSLNCYIWCMNIKNKTVKRRIWIYSYLNYYKKIFTLNFYFYCY